MATNLYSNDLSKVPSGKGMSIGIVVSEWNPEITHSMRDAAYQTLISNGVLTEDIIIKDVPGTFELTLGAQFLAEYTSVDAIICIGCVIKGETPHFDYVCQGVTHGITELNMNYNIPVIFCVLTTNTLVQAQERSGGKLGNKGEECAIATIKMVSLHNEFEDKTS